MQECRQLTKNLKLDDHNSIFTLNINDTVIKMHRFSPDI